MMRSDYILHDKQNNRHERQMKKAKINALNPLLTKYIKKQMRMVNKRNSLNAFARKVFGDQPIKSRKKNNKSLNIRSLFSLKFFTQILFSYIQKCQIKHPRKRGRKMEWHIFKNVKGWFLVNQNLSGNQKISSFSKIKRKKTDAIRMSVIFYFLRLKKKENINARAKKNKTNLLNRFKNNDFGSQKKMISKRVSINKLNIVLSSLKKDLTLYIVLFFFYFHFFKKTERVSHRKAGKIMEVHYFLDVKKNNRHSRSIKTAKANAGLNPLVTTYIKQKKIRINKTNILNCFEGKSFGDQSIKRRKRNSNTRSSRKISAAMRIFSIFPQLLLKIYGLMITNKKNALSKKQETKNSKLIYSSSSEKKSITTAITSKKQTHAFPKWYSPLNKSMPNHSSISNKKHIQIGSMLFDILSPHVLKTFFLSLTLYIVFFFSHFHFFEKIVRSFSLNGIFSLFRPKKMFSESHRGLGLHTLLWQKAQLHAHSSTLQEPLLRKSSWVAELPQIIWSVVSRVFRVFSRQAAFFSPLYKMSHCLKKYHISSMFYKIGVMVFLSDVSYANCTGRFVNPITDVCWSCLFPITIGGARVSTSGEDTPNTNAPLCTCPAPPPIFQRVGFPVSFWEPARLVDVTRTPYCLVNMGGVQLANRGTKGHGVVGNTHNNGLRNSFYQVHWYMYPVIYWLELFMDFLCLEAGQVDISYITELDPLWNDDETAFILNPEAVLFGNPIAQAACAADCLTASTGFAFDALFWCGGCQGSLYPFSGSVSNHVGGVQASLLVTQRMIAKLHRQGMLKGHMGSEGLCQKYPMPIIKKTQYKTQMVFPIPSTSSGNCQPLGRSEALWSSGREFPYKGEDYGYLIWRKRNCCVL